MKHFFVFVKSPLAVVVAPKKKRVGGRGEGNKKKSIKKILYKNAISPFGTAIIKKVSVLLSALVKRFGVYHMQDFEKN